MGCSALVLATLASTAAAAPVTERYEFVEPHMGTLVSIVLYAHDAQRAQAAAKRAFARIAQLDRALSDYHAQSELMRLTREPVGVPVGVRADLYDVLHLGEQLSILTDGAFDITIGPLSQLWRQARRNKRLPTDESRTAAARAVGYRNLQLDPVRRTVILREAGMQLDAGGIAKGYAADAALSILKHEGFERAMVAASGDLALGSPPPDAPGWKVALAPFGASNSNELVAFDVGVSTSGAAEQALEVNGTSYSHIVDPATGLGMTDPIGVTVIAPTATRADGLATACSVLGTTRCRQRIAMLDAPVRVRVQRNTGEIEAFGAIPAGVVSVSP